MDIPLEAIGETSQTTTILALALSIINQGLCARSITSSTENTTQVHILHSIPQDVRNPNLRSQSKLAQHIGVVRDISVLERNSPSHSAET